MSRHVNRLGLLGALLIALLCLSLSACSGKKNFTDADFRNLKQGMPEAEVLAVLGSPDRTERAGGGWISYFWVANGNEYSVLFEQGKVLNWAAVSLGKQ